MNIFKTKKDDVLQKVSSLLNDVARSNARLNSQNDTAIKNFTSALGTLQEDFKAIAPKLQKLTDEKAKEIDKAVMDLVSE